MGFRLLPAAEADLDGIVQHIAESHPRASRRWLDRITDRFGLLGEMPGAGAPRFEVRPGLRILPVGRYVILYRQEGDDAVIARVVHGARRWEDMV
jgi:toxin ParE1/3/4